VIRAADDVDAIYAAIQRVREEAVPMCPIAETRRLYDCLRSPARCGVTCPHKDDWIGPEGG
jgi:hypothetical protein